ncbi:MAG: hypothetical protein HEQ23_05645 [Tepidisphaera sp.]
MGGISLAGAAGSLRRRQHDGGESGEGGGGAAGLDGAWRIHDALVEEADRAGLVLAGEDALVTSLHLLEGFEGFADGFVFGESEELSGRELVLGDEVLDAEVELEEIGEEGFV